MHNVLKTICCWEYSQSMYPKGQSNDFFFVKEYFGFLFHDYSGLVCDYN